MAIAPLMALPSTSSYQPGRLVEHLPDDDERATAVHRMYSMMRLLRYSEEAALRTVKVNSEFGHWHPR